MMDLNEIAKKAYNNAEKRAANGGMISTATRKMLKHTATEVVEAMEAYVLYGLCDIGKDNPTSEITNKEYQEYRGAFASELADIICCVLIMAHGEGIDIEQAVLDCLEKNRKRAEGTGDKK